MNTVHILLSNNSQHKFHVEIIKRARLEQAHKWLTRGISRCHYGSTPLAFFIRMDDVVKLALAIPPNMALDITLCKAASSTLYNTCSKPLLLFKCDATALARGLTSVFQISGPYSFRISGDTISVSGKGREGFALPRTH